MKSVLAQLKQYKKDTFLTSRLYDATEGAVRVGRQGVREYDLEILRNEVSVVLQKNVLFSGTILDLRWACSASASPGHCSKSRRSSFWMTPPTRWTRPRTPTGFWSWRTAE